MKKEGGHLLLLYVLLLVFFVNLVFSSVTLSSQDITLYGKSSIELPIYIQNENNFSTNYSAIIICNDCLKFTDNHEDYYKNINFKLFVFNKSEFLPMQAKTGILRIESLNVFQKTFAFDVLILENSKIIKNETVFVKVSEKSSVEQSNSILNFKNKFSITNYFFIFIIVFFFCYFGLKLFIKTARQELSREMFFLVLIISTIAITYALILFFRL
ncbi:MAG: hypothetical protein WC755_02465 [Candidatus Woesearchaeota archaeon]|jgi:hypothetical protein